MDATGMQEEGGELRDRVMLATLPNVVFDGWSLQALRDGAGMVGIGHEEAMRVFPGGVPDLVEHFSAWADREMLHAMEAHGLDAMKVRERVALGVRLRLEALSPHREAVRRLVPYLALPPNMSLGVRLLYRTVDAIWYAAGDTATDFSHYTKRALLSGVYSATVLYWLDDGSEDFRDTWEFLDRRIADVMRIGRATATLGGLGGLARALPSPFRFARQIRRRARDSGMQPMPPA
jgi:ubiquinone biosynthesis protein COQ9